MKNTCVFYITKIKWKIHVFFTLHFKFWKYALLTTSYFVSFRFILAFTPMNCQRCCCHMETSQMICTVDWLTGFCVEETLTVNGIISAILHNFPERHSALPKKEKKSLKRFIQTPYPHNSQGLLIKARVFCWCSFIFAQKKMIVTV